MSKINLFLSALAVLAVAVALAGCSGGEEAAQPTAPVESEAGAEPADHDHDDHDSHAGHDHPEHDDADPAVKEALAQLSDEDRAAAEAQKICPVTGEALGSMGKPCKITVTTGAGEDRTVFLCCGGCESSIKEAPDKYLAKLDK